MDVDLTRVRHLVAVAAHGSFSRAAEEVNITQPALSRSIATFEERCGFRVFERGRNGVEPTVLGRTVIAEAEALLRNARNFGQNIKLYAGGDAGTIAIALGPLLASIFLPALGSELLRAHPGLHVCAEIGLPERHVDDLLAGRIELIIANSWKVAGLEELEIEPIGAIPLNYVARGGHPLAGRTVAQADLAPFPVASATEAFAKGLSRSAGSFGCDNYHILRELVLTTDCIWISSPALLGEDLAAGRIAVLDVADSPLQGSEIALITCKGRTMSPAARAIAARVKQLLAS